MSQLPPADEETVSYRVVIDFDEDGYEGKVYHTPTWFHIEPEPFSLAPNPTWASPMEQTDIVVDAVRRFLDRMHEHLTGEKIERND